MYVFDVIKKKSFHATKENKIEKTKIYRLKDVEILETNLRENRSKVSLFVALHHTLLLSVFMPIRVYLKFLVSAVFN